MNVFITITVTHTDKCNQPLHIMHTEKYSFTRLVVKDLGEDAHCFLFEWIQHHFLDHLFVHICIRQAFI